MDLNEFIKHFAEQFDETDSEIFEPTTVFKDLEEWSSLTALSVIAMVDEELEKRITGADIRNSNSIEDLYNILKDR